MLRRIFETGQIRTRKSSDALRESALATGRLHLGCGRNVMKGWTNIDQESQRGVLCWNLTEALPLPDASVQYIFAEHFIEHVSWAESLRLLGDCNRLLKPGGAFRLSTPDLAFLVNQYSLAKTDEWHDMGWSPSTPCAMLNEGLRLWGHQHVYDRAELHRALKLAGFLRIEDAEWRKSKVAELAELEIRPYHQEIIIEAWK